MQPMLLLAVHAALPQVTPVRVADASCGQAWPLLESERGSMANDKAALDALGVLSAERGEYQQAEWCFRRALKVDGTDLTALSNIGILLAKQGKLTEAAGLLRQAFERNQDVAGLAMNLARVECGMGYGSAARAVLESAAKYNPGVAEIREFAQRTAECRVGGGQAQ